MVVFELIVGLLLVSVLLGLAARRLHVPYPTLLAVGGTILAFLPHAPHVELDPEMALALFVAPILVDSGFDTSLRDLKDNWRGVLGLVVVAVGVTTFVAASVVHAMVPAIPWAAAIALGAIVAPPDAAAATAVLKHVTIPHRILTLLEGESLLNDASALLIYRVAVGAALAGSFSWSSAVPVFGLGVVASVIVGPLIALLFTRCFRYVDDAPSATILQFVGAFGIWMFAERFHLSAVLVTVSFAITAGRIATDTPARMRVPSFAVWETAVYILNVLAFILVGLQIGPILERLPTDVRHDYYVIAAAVVAAVIMTRVALVMTINGVGQVIMRYRGHNPKRPHMVRPTKRGGFVIGWCGMRGIVTLAAAYALPDEMPYRDLLVLCAFAVVLGTLVIQGLSLPIILRLLKLEDNDPVGREVLQARAAAYEAALATLEGNQTPLAQALRHEMSDLLHRARGEAPADGDDVSLQDLRRAASAAARKAVLHLRTTAVIGDAAYHRLEEELDWAELTTERG